MLPAYLDIGIKHIHPLKAYTAIRDTFLAALVRALVNKGVSPLFITTSIGFLARLARGNFVQLALETEGIATKVAFGLVRKRTFFIDFVAQDVTVLFLA